MNNTNILSSGRFPWYDKEGNPFTPYVLGIAGGSASGKTSVSTRIIKSLNVPWVVLISMDSFYKSLTQEQIDAAHRNDYNFDHPNAFDFDAVYETLTKLKKGIKVDVPVYDFVTHSRLNKTTPVYGANVVIFEGIFALHDKKVRDLMDMMIFVDTDADIRLARRLKRDISERGRDLMGVLDQYNKFVKPAFDEHIYPTMKHADIIIPRGLDNIAAINVITKHVSRQLNERGLPFLRNELASDGSLNDPNILPETFLKLKMTNELKTIHTIVRDENTCKHDFIFFASRLSRYVVERALNEISFEDVAVPTPTGGTYNGTSCNSKICGVSVIRAGAAMEQGLRSVVKDIPIGKVLIQTNPSTGAPQLHYCKLPHDIHDRYVLVMDSTIATGAAALMAIRVILDHNVPQERIIFCTLIATAQGIHTISRAFPKVKIIASEVDPEMNEKFHILPGFGNFGDRYFGTD